MVCDSGQVSFCCSVSDGLTDPVYPLEQTDNAYKQALSSYCGSVLRCMSGLRRLGSICLYLGVSVSEISGGMRSCGLLDGRSSPEGLVLTS